MQPRRHPHQSAASWAIAREGAFSKRVDARVSLESCLDQPARCHRGDGHHDHQVGRARGAVESMPISAAVMNEGGMALFIMVKLALVAAGATAVLDRKSTRLNSSHT